MIRRGLLIGSGGNGGGKVLYEGEGYDYTSEDEIEINEPALIPGEKLVFEAVVRSYVMLGPGESPIIGFTVGSERSKTYYGLYMSMKYKFRRDTQYDTITIGREIAPGSKIVLTVEFVESAMNKCNITVDINGENIYTYNKCMFPYTNLMTLLIGIYYLEKLKVTRY